MVGKLIKLSWDGLSGLVIKRVLVLRWLLTPSLLIA